ncbi:hypothetical protein EYF80_005732 [Liparis tanakae]|uniref:Uncharacterized protein n=1 Tax=Liparis tanakae TaxID=230148 RepID=A0A4Z2J1L1_9TELE|nr:hypothetical protein EYF80_005732 [Liparis tanakae]
MEWLLLTVTHSATLVYIKGAGAEQGEKRRTSAFTNNELHPLTAVLTAQQSTLGQNPFPPGVLN